MQITLIRHLPTEWNKLEKLQGRRDIPISPVSERFQQDIIINQKQLDRLEPFDLILSSTLIRTRQTARFYGYEPETESLLDELDFGLFEGRSKAELAAAFAGKWVEDPKSIVLGERVEQLEERIMAFINKYKRYSNILVFGHGSWMRAMLSYHQYGNINKMNKVTVQNNQCITLLFNRDWEAL
ncbi:histidine phosphatase family protein [Bacillus rubiinfantis]|uniref:histidine phosphatase family protein n=1 Tax=Bacillus rubiinfantis TaxID=1499680 RepID=UPI0005A76CB8|nr:histidine phosphatase family protein [Bacillus rubiinfantis]